MVISVQLRYLNTAMVDTQSASAPHIWVHAYCSVVELQIFLDTVVRNPTYCAAKTDKKPNRRRTFIELSYDHLLTVGVSQYISHTKYSCK